METFNYYTSYISNNKSDNVEIVKKIKEVAIKGNHIFAKDFNFNRTLKSIKAWEEQGYIVYWYEKETNKLLGVLIWNISDGDWFTHERILTEVLVLRLDDDFYGFQRLAIWELKYLADWNDCKYIHSGNLLTPPKLKRMVANAYLKAGFEETYSAFIFER